MIGIVNYEAGNIFSLTAALKRLNIDYGMVNEKADFERYDRIIIPGVGHAGAAMQKLQDSDLASEIPLLKKPVLGICVGMQLMTNFSEEGNAELLGIFPIKTLHFENRIQHKVPHTGWNNTHINTDCRLFEGIIDQSYFYFVHSFFIEYEEKYTSASCDYGITFSAGIWKDNFYGVQFHPEKSGKSGEKLLENFANL